MQIKFHEVCIALLLVCIVVLLNFFAENYKLQQYQIIQKQQTLERIKYTRFLESKLQTLKQQNQQLEIKLKQSHNIQPTSQVSRQIESIINQYNSSHKPINKSLVLAIAKIESNFNPNARNSYSGASGLFQFMPSTYISIIKKHNLQDKGIFNIESNTVAAIHYIQDLLDSHNNDVDKVLASYLGSYNQSYINKIKRLI